MTIFTVPVPLYYWSMTLKDGGFTDGCTMPPHQLRDPMAYPPPGPSPLQMLPLHAHISAIE